MQVHFLFYLSYKSGLAVDCKLLLLLLYITNQETVWSGREMLIDNQNWQLLQQYTYSHFQIPALLYQIAQQIQCMKITQNKIVKAKLLKLIQFGSFSSILFLVQVNINKLIIIILRAIIKLMNHLRKSMNDQQKIPSIKKSNSMQKQDIFQQFEKSGKVQRSALQQNEPKNIGFKLKTQNKRQAKNEDDYADDFDDLQITDTVKSKRKSNDLYDIQKNQSKLQKLNTNKQKDQANTLKLMDKQKRSSKSVMQGPQLSVMTPQMGKFEAEVDKRFGLIDVKLMSTDALNRANQQIRDYIKKYNDMLTEIINKNLVQFTSKKKKPATSEQLCKVLQQQARNNKKIQQMDLMQLKKLQDYQLQLEQQQEYNEGKFDQEVKELHESIKQIKKNITKIKLQVTNQGKKLMPNDLVFSKPETQSQLAILKQKLMKLKKQFDRNEEKFNSLDQRQLQLISKNDQILDKNKEATEIKRNSKQNDNKNKKYQQLKKKFESLKSHLTKSNSLWNTKCSVSNHENDAIRTNIKNVELQIKNMQQSTRQTYEKTMKTLNQTKPKSQANKRALEKLLQQMKGYESVQSNLTKQMSLSHMKLLNAKKQSLNYLHQDENQKTSKKEQTLVSNKQENLQQDKNKSQKNRVWKLQNRDSVKQAVSSQLQNKDQHKGDNRNQNKIDKEIFEKKQPTENKQIDKNQTKVQNMPKKFNFSRNKANSSSDQVSKNQIKQNVDKQQFQPNQINKQKNTNINSVQLNANSNKQLSQNLKQNQVKMLNTHQNLQPSLKNLQSQEQSIIKPKRLNISLNKNKQKQQGSSGYLPFNEVPQNVQKKDQKDENVTNTQISKPSFNLRRKIDSQKKKEPLTLDNQFMAS